jgi:hypothetical protein
MQDMLSDVKTAFDLFKESISLFRAAKDCLPDSSEKTVAERTMVQAELSAKVAEAKLAQSLGFQLCPKDWPPVILLATEVHGNVDLYQCPSCGTRFTNHGKRNNRINLREYHQESENPQSENHE